MLSMHCFVLMKIAAAAVSRVATAAAAALSSIWLKIKYNVT